MIRLSLAGLMVGFLAVNAFAQGLAVNSDNSDPNSNAMLDVSSPATGNGKGMLVPRITAAQRTTASAALAGGLLDDSGDLRGGAAQGLLVYQTDGTQGFYYNSSSTATPSWIFLTSGSSDSGNTPNTIVSRDGSGDFLANIITANFFVGTLQGTANTATVATEAQALNGTITTAAGTIDGVVIGGTTPAAATFSQTVSLNSEGAYYLGSDKVLHKGKGALLGNLIVGDGGVSFDNSGGGVNGLYNTFFGLGAGYYNSSGYQNTAAGYHALRSNATGIWNTAFGYNALANNTDSNNTAFGADALSSNVGGVSNTAVGGAALEDNTAGNFNTAVGLNCLPANISGDGNTASGCIALYKNNTGYNNTASGYQALYENTTGYDNCAFGNAAIASNSTGFGNCGVGVNSLGKSTGNGNTAVGDRAGDNMTSGNNNTFVGSNADASVTTLSNAIAIGYGAQVGASDTTVIGNSSMVTIGGYTTWSNFSDRREKDNIRPTAIGLEFIEKLEPVKFNYKNQDESVVHDGFIAQDVERVCDELDVEFGGLRRPANPDTGRYMLSYSEFVVPLVNAVKEQQRRIETLEAEIKALKGK